MKLYRLEELAEVSGVSARNIRYYTAQGLLPAPDARGRFALYTDDHLRRLKMIQRLKDAFFPLDMIRAQLSQLTDAQLDGLLAEREPSLLEEAASPPADSAADYIRRVLAKPPAPPPAPAAAPRAAAPPSPSPSAAPEAWQRITLAPGVELHARQVDSFVQKLIAYAKSLRPSDR